MVKLKREHGHNVNTWVYISGFKTYTFYLMVGMSATQEFKLVFISRHLVISFGALTG